MIVLLASSKISASDPEKEKGTHLNHLGLSLLFQNIFLGRNHQNQMVKTISQQCNYVASTLQELTMKKMCHRLSRFFTITPHIMKMSSKSTSLSWSSFVIMVQLKNPFP
jgi:hypothetical protein